MGARAARGIRYEWCGGCGRRGGRDGRRICKGKALHLSSKGGVPARRDAWTAAFSALMFPITASKSLMLGG